MFYLPSLFKEEIDYYQALLTTLDKINPPWLFKKSSS